MKDKGNGMTFYSNHRNCITFYLNHTTTFKFTENFLLTDSSTDANYAMKAIIPPYE